MHLAIKAAISSQGRFVVLSPPALIGGLVVRRLRIGRRLAPAVDAPARGGHGGTRRKLVSLLLGLVAAALAGCGTLAQQAPTQPAPGQVAAASSCVSPEADWECMRATPTTVPAGAVWVAEAACACWHRDQATAIAAHFEAVRNGE